MIASRQLETPRWMVRGRHKGVEHETGLRYCGALGRNDVAISITLDPHNLHMDMPGDFRIEEP